jgi:hypothetical protein
VTAIGGAKGNLRAGGDGRSGRRSKRQGNEDYPRIKTALFFRMYFLRVAIPQMEMGVLTALGLASRYSTSNLPIISTLRWNSPNRQIWPFSRGLRVLRRAGFLAVISHDPDPKQLTMRVKSHAAFLTDAQLGSGTSPRFIRSVRRREDQA